MLPKKINKSTFLFFWLVFHCDKKNSFIENVRYSYFGYLLVYLESRAANRNRVLNQFNGKMQRKISEWKQRETKTIWFD